MSLNFLPVQGTTNTTKNIWDCKNGMLYTLQLIDSVRTAPYGLPTDLAQVIENMRFHVGVALALLDHALITGHSYQDSAANVDDYSACVSLYLDELQTAKQLWNQWLLDAQSQGTLQGLGYFGQEPSAPITAEADKTTTDVTLEALQQKEAKMSSYLVLGGLAVAIAGIWAMTK